MPISTWLKELLPSGSDPIPSVEEQKARETRRNGWALAGSKTMSADYKRVTMVGGGKPTGANASLAAPPRSQALGAKPTK